jgi:hypothetical protein
MLLAVVFRHGHCCSIKLLVKVWVILDRPPNDPFLRKKEPFTSSLCTTRSVCEVGVTLGGRFCKTHPDVKMTRLHLA